MYLLDEESEARGVNKTLEISSLGTAELGLNAGSLAPDIRLDMESRKEIGFGGRKGKNSYL